MNLKYLIKVANTYGASSETMKFVRDLFLQGDGRYDSIVDDAIVAGFIDHQAIVVEKRSAPDDLHKVKVDKKLLRLIGLPQKDYKLGAAKLLILLGFDFVCTEVRFQGGFVDVLGKGKNKTIAIECGPCRISKAIEYLEEENVELWLIPLDFWQNKKFFVMARGPNWKNYFEFHENYKIKQLKSIKNPLEVIL